MRPGPILHDSKWFIATFPRFSDLDFFFKADTISFKFYSICNWKKNVVSMYISSLALSQSKQLANHLNKTSLNISKNVYLHLHPQFQQNQLKYCNLVEMFYLLLTQQASAEKRWSSFCHQHQYELQFWYFLLWMIPNDSVDIGLSTMNQTEMF